MRSSSDPTPGDMPCRALLVDVFLYSYYIDPALLAARGVIARHPRTARLRGWRLVLESDSTLARDSRQDAYGVVYALTREELDRLYDWPGIATYRPVRVHVEYLQTAGQGEVLCYLCDTGTDSRPPDPAHVDNLLRAMRAYGLPAGGVRSEGGVLGGDDAELLDHLAYVLECVALDYMNETRAELGKVIQALGKRDDSNIATRAEISGLLSGALDAFKAGDRRKGVGLLSQGSRRLWTEAWKKSSCGDATA